MKNNEFDLDRAGGYTRFHANIFTEMIWSIIVIGRDRDMLGLPIKITTLYLLQFGVH